MNVVRGLIILRTLKASNFPGLCKKNIAGGSITAGLQTQLGHPPLVNRITPARNVTYAALPFKSAAPTSLDQMPLLLLLLLPFPPPSVEGFVANVSCYSSGGGWLELGARPKRAERQLTLATKPSTDGGGSRRRRRRRRRKTVLRRDML